MCTHGAEYAVSERHENKDITGCKEKETETTTSKVTSESQSTTADSTMLTTTTTTTKAASKTQPQNNVVWSSSMKVWRKLCEGKTQINVSFGNDSFDITYPKPIQMTRKIWSIGLLMHTLMHRSIWTAELS